MTATRVSSFSKALALGEIHEDVVFPYPIPRGEEAEKVRNLILLIAGAVTLPARSRAEITSA